MSSTARLEIGQTGLNFFSKALPDFSECPGNCSGHGSCQDGHCICLVQFSGGMCHDINIGYYIAFGSIFVLLGLVTLIQLVICVLHEYHQEEKRSWHQACQVTVQKLLYVLVICATAIRGVYFFTKWQVSEDLATSLWSAYFPFIITGFSLIICFWAEAFHISAIANSQRKFLSKSTIFFIAFNVALYILFITQLIIAERIDNEDAKMLLVRIFHGGFAFLMIIVVVFFLIYGVEVYFKVRGAFRGTENNLDDWQLKMSRLGLVAQAVLQLITALFLVSDVTADVWKNKLPVLSQNFYDIGFRVVEFGLALWFPCVLWNCGRPEELWVLNPKRIFRSFDFQQQNQDIRQSKIQKDGISICEGIDQEQNKEDSSVRVDCWICYDSDRKDMGPLIQPCKCKGDVATVHHDCLQKWLVESAPHESKPECRVCGEQYQLQTHYWIPKGLRPRHWLQSFLALLLLIGSPFAAYTICHSLSASSTYLRIIVIGATIVCEFLAVRLFFTYIRSSFQRVKVATMKISGKQIRQNIKTEDKSMKTELVIQAEDLAIHTEDMAIKTQDHVVTCPANGFAITLQPSTGVTE